MNRSAAAIGIGVLAIAVIVGVILFLQLPSPDAPSGQARPSEATGEAPATPAIATAPAPGGAAAPAAPGSVVPSLDVARVDRQGNVVIAGKAGADCTVTVRVGDIVVGTATADRRGDWVIVPGEPLPVGESQLTLSAQCGDAAPVDAGNVVVLLVPERAPESVPGAVPGSIPVPVPAPSTAGDGAIAVVVPRDSSKPAEIMQAANAPAAGMSIDSVDYDEQGRMVISGRAPAGSSVQVYLDNRLVGRAEADAAGRWNLQPDATVAPGTYVLRADLIRPDGTVGTRAEIPFVRGEPLGDLPAGRIVVIQPGDYLWRIARKSYGAGTRYTLIYDANRAQIRDPDLIYPGQVFALPKVN